MPACTFIGHADFKESETRLIYDAVTDLITNEGVTTFYVGTHGNFDKAVYRVLCQIENLYKIRIIVVLSSLNKKPNYFDMNKIIFPDILASTPPKFAIIKRN